MTTDSQKSVSEVNSRLETVTSNDHRGSDGSFLPITGYKLNGSNYLQWSQFVLMFIGSKDKDGYLTGEITAKEMWDAVKETYFTKENTAEQVDIETVLHDLRQGDLTVTNYYNILARHWQQLDVYEEYDWNCPEDTAKILGTKPLPTIHEAFAEVKREESWKKLMLGKQTAAATTESSALAARDWKPRSNGRDSWANNATTDSTSQPKSNPFSKEQLDLLQKLLQQSLQPKPPQPTSITGLYLLQANEYPNPSHSQANVSQAHSIQSSNSVLSIRSDNK
ncbi:hypothetical protein CK203_082618 [Vitis vinifera]|uniref:Retrotransposon gag domain-containing protein n=1 Tax=Vitis vinifera TaxID=29760 RepID=A0A438BWQ8_VITVI|nr:hypothetical protein CK203_082618 [Vitis vinifera]